MLPDGLMDIWVYRAGWAAAGLALLIAVVRLLFQRSIPPSAAFAETAGPSPSRGWPVAALTMLLGAAAGYAIFRLHAPFLISGDEYFRSYYGYRWSRDLFFAPADHIWLAGQFYILGTFSRLLGTMTLTVAITSLVGSLLTVLGAAMLARRVWNSSAAGVTAGVLVGSHWIMLWAAVNPLAEVFFYPALLFALERWLAAMQEPADTEESLNRRDWALFNAALLTGFGTMFRFEMWYVGLLLGFVLSLRLVRMIWRGESARRAFGCLLACAVIAAYPVAWAISSWMHLGSPLAFARDAAAMNEETNIFHDMDSLWSRFLIYPLSLWGDHWMWMALPAGGVALAFFPDRWRRAMPLVLTTVAITLFAMIVASRSGIGSNTRARYTMFIVLPLLVLGAGPLAVIWDSVRSRMRWAAQLLVVGVVGFTAYVSADKAVEYYPNGFALSPEWLEMITRLERENDRSREFLDFARIQPHDTRLYKWSHGSFFIEYLMILHHSHTPRQVYYLATEDELIERMQTSRAGSRFLLRKPLPDWEFPARTVFVEDLGDYELWTQEW